MHIVMSIKTPTPERYLSNQQCTYMDTFPILSHVFRKDEIKERRVVRIREKVVREKQDRGKEHERRKLKNKEMTEDNNST